MKEREGDNEIELNLAQTRPDIQRNISKQVDHVENVLKNIERLLASFFSIIECSACCCSCTHAFHFAGVSYPIYFIVRCLRYPYQKSFYMHSYIFILSFPSIVVLIVMSEL